MTDVYPSLPDEPGKPRKAGDGQKPPPVPAQYPEPDATVDFGPPEDQTMFVEGQPAAQKPSPKKDEDDGPIVETIIVEPGKTPESGSKAPASKAPGTSSGVSGSGTSTYRAPGGSKSDFPTIHGVTIEREIGRGGMGVVYAGRQDYLDRKVAIKLLNVPDDGDVYAARFQREAKILASLAHPNVVACYQAGVLDDGQCYLIMEFVDGPDLLKELREHGARSVDTSLRVTRDMALALKSAYELDIIHRDVKPANVLLQCCEGVTSDFPFRPKLADLGLARPSSETDMDLTVPGSVMGSPPTMAPEQFNDPDSVDYRADIYALGCVLFHMLTGERAFQTTSIGSTIAKKMQDKCPDPLELKADLPAPVADLVKRMLAREREDRPQSYDEIVDECTRLLEGATSRIRPPKTKAKPAKKASPVFAALATVALLGGGGFAGWYYLLGGGAQSVDRGDVARDDGTDDPTNDGGSSSTGGDGSTTPVGPNGAGGGDANPPLGAIGANGAPGATGVPGATGSDESASSGETPDSGDDGGGTTPGGDGIDANTGGTETVDPEPEPWRPSVEFRPELIIPDPLFKEGAVDESPLVDPGKTERRKPSWSYTPVDTDSRWSQAIEKPGRVYVLATTTKAIGQIRAARVVNEGNWLLRGYVEPEGRFTKQDYGLRVFAELDDGTMYGFELTTPEEGVVVRTGPFERDASGVWRVEDPAAASTTIAYDDYPDGRREIEVTLRWKDGVLSVEWARGDGPTGGGELTIGDETTGHMPVRFGIGVDYGRASFGDFVVRPAK